MRVISNTGPIIAFNEIGLLPVLQELYKEIIIPEAVFKEITNYKYKATINLDQFPFIQVETDVKTNPLLKNSLDPGEAEAISLALSSGADLLIIDEKKGRRFAENIYNLKIIGTAGLLLIAKKKELVERISPLFDKLLDARYFISKTIIEATCKLAGE